MNGWFEANGQARARRAALLALALALTAGTSSGARGADDRSRVYRVAFINAGPSAPNEPNAEAFRKGMRELGYIEGKNLVIDFRWGDSKAERLPGIVDSLLAKHPDVILSGGGQDTIQALKAAKTTVPVVFITGDPLGEGVVRSLQRPEGNYTGLAVLGQSIEGKRLERLRLAVPGVRRVAIVWNNASEMHRKARDDARVAAATMGMEVAWFEARNEGELNRVLDAIPAAKVDALMVLGDPMLGFRRKQLVEFATRHRLPGVYFWREFAVEGGLMSYGTSLTAVYRGAASYVDKIFKGARPGDLPVEQPTTFEFVINLSAAKAIGIQIPRAVREIADEVIP